MKRQIVNMALGTIIICGVLLFIYLIGTYPIVLIPLFGWVIGFIITLPPEKKREPMPMKPKPSKANKK